jgi:hypothetical protein
LTVKVRYRELKQMNADRMRVGIFGRAVDFFQNEPIKSSTDISQYVTSAD